MITKFNEIFGYGEGMIQKMILRKKLSLIRDYVGYYTNNSFVGHGKLTNLDIPFGIDSEFFKKLLNEDLIDINEGTIVLILQKVVNQDGILTSNILKN